MLTAEKRHRRAGWRIRHAHLPAPAVSVPERAAEARTINSAEHFFPVAPVSGRRSIRRRLAAILGADIRGYSMLMAAGEEAAHRRVNAAMDRLMREIQKSHGRVISHAGDGLMAEFPSAVEALKCALRSAGRFRQAQCAPVARNAHRISHGDQFRRGRPAAGARRWQRDQHRREAGTDR